MSKIIKQVFEGMSVTEMFLWKGEVGLKIHPHSRYDNKTNMIFKVHLFEVTINKEKKENTKKYVYVLHPPTRLRRSVGVC